MSHGYPDPHKQHELQNARLVLLDDKLYEYYKNDPLVHAHLRPYINHGEKNLNQCLTELVIMLIEARRKDFEAAMFKQLQPTIKIGEVK